MTDEIGNTGYTRRDVLATMGMGGLAVVAGTTPAQAQATGSEPRIQLGEDWEIDDYEDSGETNLRFRHIDTGAELVYDVSVGSWVVESFVTGEIGNDGSPVSITDSIDLSTAIIDNSGNVQLNFLGQIGENQGMVAFAPASGNEADDALFDNSMIWRIDESTDDLEFVVQKSDGTQLTGSVSLS